MNHSNAIRLFRCPRELPQSIQGFGVVVSAIQYSLFAIV